MRRLRWEPPGSARKVPKHPFRDSALLYGALAIIVVVIAVATGGGFARALVIAVLVFLVATAWTWRNWRNRIREDELRRDAERIP